MTGVWPKGYCTSCGEPCARCLALSDSLDTLRSTLDGVLLDMHALAADVAAMGQHLGGLDFVVAAVRDSTAALAEVHSKEHVESEHGESKPDP